MLAQLGGALPRELTGRRRYRAWGIVLEMPIPILLLETENDICDHFRAVNRRNEDADITSGGIGSCATRHQLLPPCRSLHYWDPMGIVTLPAVRQNSSWDEHRFQVMGATEVMSAHVSKAVLRALR
jgi:hypothetical protein